MGVPRKRTTQNKITVPLPPDIAEIFFAYIQAQRRSIASAGVHLIEVGLLAEAQGLEVTWRKPPRDATPTHPS